MTDNAKRPGVIERLGVFAAGPRAQRFITVLIVLNAITLGLETDADIMAQWGPELTFFDNAVLAVFCAELLAKLAHQRLSFFKDGWNVFDFIVVGIALAPATGQFSVLRALRIFRAMRLLSVVPSMRRVTQALFAAIPGILSVGSMILLIFYVGAVLATNFFGADFDAWFGSVGRSMFTLFQIMTLESWSMGIVRPVMTQFPLAWAFFVPFILVTSFAVVNLFIGIIVDAMQKQGQAEAHEMHEETHEIMRETEAIHAELRALREDIKALTAARKED